MKSIKLLLLLLFGVAGCSSSYNGEDLSGIWYFNHTIPSPFLIKDDGTTVTMQECGSPEETVYLKKENMLVLDEQAQFSIETATRMKFPVGASDYLEAIKKNDENEFNYGSLSLSTSGSDAIDISKNTCAYKWIPPFKSDVTNSSEDSTILSISGVSENEGEGVIITFGLEKFIAGEHVLEEDGTAITLSSNIFLTTYGVYNLEFDVGELNIDDLNGSNISGSFDVYSSELDLSYSGSFDAEYFSF